MGDERAENGAAIVEWVKQRCVAAAQAKSLPEKNDAPASPKL